MSTPILATKLYIPPLRPNLIQRCHLIERLKSGQHRKLTLISAPAGFGKTTLVSEWLASLQEHAEQRVAWLSLDESDNDPIRFLTYLVRAFQQLIPTIGKGVLEMLQSPQPPPPDALLTTLLNDIAVAPSASSGQASASLEQTTVSTSQVLSTPATQKLILVLDDYHVLNNDEIDQALAFLVEYLPPAVHLVITTREDPPLPLARLRARAQLTEIRATELRFTPEEAAAFLNQAMGLNLTRAEIAALEARTEGWIAGLQLAAVSIQGHLTSESDKTDFIRSFTGSHRFVMDYLLEEVLHQQPQPVQTFLLQTAILDRMCGPLCEAVLCAPAGTGQVTLEMLEQANLFLIPLDRERRWYRYHHLFGELLRQRLQQQIVAADGETPSSEELHIRASHWYEANDLELEAFHHATIANDVGRAERLIEGKGMPLHFRGNIRPVLQWLDTLPATVLDAHPSLWLAHASTLLATGQITRTEEVLHAAERLLEAKADKATLDERDRDLIGRIAAIRATVAAGLQQVDAIIAESEQALRYLHPDNLAFRTSTNWKLGYAYHLSGDFTAAKMAYQEAIARSEASGNKIFTIMSHIGLADVYQIEAQLPTAAEHFQNAADLFGEQLLPSASEAYSGLAQIYYEWNQLDVALDYAERGLQLGRQWENSDTPIRSEWILARVHLARGEVATATAQLKQLIRRMSESNFTRHLDGVVTTYIHALLAQGEPDSVLEESVLKIVEETVLPLSQARLLLYCGCDENRSFYLTKNAGSYSERSIVSDVTDEANRQLEAIQQQLGRDGQQHRLVQVMALRAVALYQNSQTVQALQLLRETLMLAEPGGYIRLFVDEGPVMAGLLAQLSADNTDNTNKIVGVTPAYIQTLLEAFPPSAEPLVVSPPHDEIPNAMPNAIPKQQHSQPTLAEPLSDRELEVLTLIAAGQKNQEIADQLFVSLNTVRYHTKNLYGKLNVNKRTQAVARAQELGLL